MGRLLYHRPVLTRTAADARFWRLHLARQEHLQALGMEVLGDDLSASVPTPTTVTSAAFLTAFEVMIRRCAASGARPVLVYSGAGVWDNTFGAGLAFVDTQLANGRLIGVVWLNDLAALLDAVLPTDRLHAWLDCGFHCSVEPIGSTRTVTPAAVVPSGAVRFRPTDAVYPISPTGESSEEDAASTLGTLSQSWSVRTVTLSEIDPTDFSFRLFDVRPLLQETSLGFLLLVSQAAQGVEAPFVPGKEYWRWNSGTTPWPASFRLVPVVNPGYPDIGDIAGVEAFNVSTFPGAPNDGLPTSIAGGPFYQLSKLVGGTSVPLDAYFHHLIENNQVFTRWYAATGALSGGYLNLEAGASLVFTSLSAPPTGGGQRHTLSLARQ